MIEPHAVMETLRRVMLVDGFDLVIDFERSRGSRIVDARSGRSWLDMFSMVASQPLGMNHPRLTEPEFVARLGRVAVHKPSNSDIYSCEMAEFVERFTAVAAPGWTRHLFLIDGGTLAVENALKVAFDWKAARQRARGRAEPAAGEVLHFRHAFHGRSGYSLSLTNTEPVKTRDFPAFDWPRVSSPAMSFPCVGAALAAVQRAEAVALAEIDAAIASRGAAIAALILEPIQGEGGDRHFRPEFLAALRQRCDEHEMFFILDEVQTGFGMTGTWWAHQQLGVEPDAMAFGKKTQVCGVAVGPRVDEVQPNVFQESSRINSTWGGTLVDMVRCARYLEVITAEGLVANAESVGRHALNRLRELETRLPDRVGNARGRGLFLAFDLKPASLRPEVLKRAFAAGLIVLPSGPRSIRLRPALNIGTAEIDEAVGLLEAAITGAASPTG